MEFADAEYFDEFLKHLFMRFKSAITTEHIAN